jgi:hypothetical protein
VHGVRGRDVGHANQAEEERPVGRQAELHQVVVSRHARVGPAIARGAAHDPLVARGASVMDGGWGGAGPVRGIAVDGSRAGQRDRRQQEKRQEDACHD